MTDILVKCLSLLPSNTRFDVGRYFEIEPISGNTLRPGLTARFFAQNTGKKVTEGTLVEMPGGGLAVDTFKVL